MEEAADILKIITYLVCIGSFLTGVGGMIWTVRHTNEEVKAIKKELENGVKSEAKQARIMGEQHAETLKEVKESISEVNDKLNKVDITLALLGQKVSLRGCANFKRDGEGNA